MPPETTVGAVQALPRRLPSRSWPELVMHVLAHVQASATLPASVYDSRYVAFVEAHAGPAAARPLGEDATVLGRVVLEHVGLARLQLLAWLFDDVATAAACAAVDLEQVPADQLARGWVVGALQPCMALAEVLRCAALLEAEVVAHLPAARVDDAELEAELATLVAAAPWLPRFGIMPLRPLCRRGRVAEGEIWVGTPQPQLHVGVEHVAWQAAHEATVAEVASWCVPADGASSSPARSIADTPAPRLSEREVEAVAVVVLAERAAAPPLQAGHRRWLAHFGEHAPSTRRQDLPPLHQYLMTQRGL